MTADEASQKSAESPKLKKKSDDDDSVVKKKKKGHAEKRGRRAKGDSGEGYTPKAPASAGSIRRRKLDLGEEGTETLKQRVKKISSDGSVSRTPTTIKKKRIPVTADREESTTEKKVQIASVGSIRRRKLDLGEDGTETPKQRVKKIGDDGSVSRTHSTIKKKKIPVTADGEKSTRKKIVRSASVGAVRRKRKPKKIPVAADGDESTSEKRDRRTKKSSMKSSSDDSYKPEKKTIVRSTSLRRKEKFPVESDGSVYSDDGEGDKDSSSHFDKLWDDNLRQSPAASLSSLSPTPRQQPNVTPSSSQAKNSKEAEDKNASILDERISQLKGENTTLQVKVQQQEHLIFTFNAEREMELSKLSKSMSDLFELKATHIDTKNTSGELRKKSFKLESTLATKDELISALESSSIDQMDRIRQLEREVGFAKQDVIRLKNGRQRLNDSAGKETPKKTQADVEDLRDELAEVQAILAERNGKIASFEKAQVDQMDLMDDLEKELEYAKDDLFRLEEEAEKRLIAAEAKSELRLIAAEEAQRRLLVTGEDPQKFDSEGVTEKARQLDEWELDLIERENQFDEERKAQEKKIAHMLDLADYEKDLADRGKKLQSEEAFWDMKEKCFDERARDLTGKEKYMTDKEKVLNEKQIELGVLEKKLSGEKETVKRNSMQVTPFLASQAALKKQHEKGLVGDDAVTIAQLRDELEKLREENQRVKKDGSKDMIDELDEQHEVAVQKLQEGIDKQMRNFFEEKHALQTQLEEEQVLAEEKLSEKDASIEFIQREMEELKEELEELLREEAERGQKETQIDAVMEENELLQDQLEEEREESAEQISEMTEAIERLHETNRELDEKIEAEAVKNKDMVIMDLENEINELNISLEKQNTNEYAAKLRQEMKELKTELNRMKTEFQDKEAGSYRNIQARDEAIQILRNEVDRVHVQLGNPVGTFELDLPEPAPPPPRVVESSGFFGMLMGS